MSRLRLLLLFSFVQSFATICIERGLMFLAHDRLGFSDEMNLWLAMSLGVAYVAGSLCSHRVSAAIGERRLLLVVIAAEMVICAAMGVWLSPLWVFVGNAVMGGLDGLKWPVVESYISAGRSPLMKAKAVGRFNIAWSLSVPLAMLPAGTIIKVWAPGLLFLPAALHVWSLWILRAIPSVPRHRPQRATGPGGTDDLPRYRALLVVSRWQMLGSYCLMWVIAALMPGVYERLGVAVTAATILAALLDVARLAAFFFLERSSLWHNRLSPLIVAMIGLPAGFFMIVLGPHVAVVLAGELAYGLAAGMIYYAALYYAMVGSNASVESSGHHEGIIGLGFAIGPMAGLAGKALTPALGPILGTVVGVSPILLICAAGAARHIRRLPRRHPQSQTSDEGPPKLI